MVDGSLMSAALYALISSFAPVVWGFTFPLHQ